MASVVPGDDDESVEITPTSVGVRKLCLKEGDPKRPARRRT